LLSTSPQQNFEATARASPAAPKVTTKKLDRLQAHLDRYVAWHNG
jgi:hypothetical protein